MSSESRRGATGAGNTDAPAGHMSGGEVLAKNFEDWTPELRREFQVNKRNYVVGGRLLSETDRLKVWEIRLAPGERLPAHMHVLDYFWTALTPGVTLQHSDEGITQRVSYTPGETRHYTFRDGEYKFHDIQNVGSSDMIFITVEHIRSADDPGPRQV